MVHLPGRISTERAGFRNMRFPKVPDGPLKISARMVHGARTSTVSNGQTDGQMDGRTDGRRGAEPPTGADFTFCAHVIIRVTNVFFKYLSPLASLGG